MGIEKISEGSFVWSAKLGKTLVIMSIGKDLEHEDIFWRNNVRFVSPKTVRCKPDEIVLMDGKYNEPAVFWIVKTSDVLAGLEAKSLFYNNVPRNWADIKIKIG